MADLVMGPQERELCDAVDAAADLVLLVTALGLESDRQRPARDEELEIAELDAVAVVCGGCGVEFDEDDTLISGWGVGTSWCSTCVDRCAESAGMQHECAVCREDGAA